MARPSRSTGSASRRRATRRSRRWASRRRRSPRPCGPRSGDSHSRLERETFVIGTDSPTLPAPTHDDVRLQRTPAPAVIVIFGATGALTSRKLLTGLYSLALQQLLPPDTAIIGAARTAPPDGASHALTTPGVDQPR